MATWVKQGSDYYNGDQFVTLGVSPESNLYLVARLADGRALKIGPFSTAANATSAITTIVGASPLVPS